MIRLERAPACGCQEEKEQARESVRAAEGARARAAEAAAAVERNVRKPEDQQARKEEEEARKAKEQRKAEQQHQMKEMAEQVLAEEERKMEALAEQQREMEAMAEQQRQAVALAEQPRTLQEKKALLSQLKEQQQELLQQQQQEQGQAREVGTQEAGESLSVAVFFASPLRRVRVPSRHAIFARSLTHLAMQEPPQRRKLASSGKRSGKRSLRPRRRSGGGKPAKGSCGTLPPAPPHLLPISGDRAPACSGRAGQGRADSDSSPG